jgi:predicted DNA-binding protein
MHEKENGTAKSQEKTRGEHCVTIHLTYEMKESLRVLAARYDRTVADIIRAVIRVGIPMMEGLSQAEEVMVKEYVQLFRKLRQVKALKDI